MTGWIEGRVVRATGEPIIAAVVVAVAADATGFQSSSLAGTSITAANGNFRMEVRPGHYELSATAPDLEAASAGPVIATAGQIAAGTSLILQPGGFALAGHVAGPDGLLAAHTRVLALPTTAAGRAYLTWSDGDGGYALALPAGDYWIGPDAEGLDPRLEWAALDTDTALDLALQRPPPPPPTDASALVAWLRQQAVVVRTAKPGSGLDDLQPIAQMIGAARVVALGEATYGARELVQLRHRLVELLVGQLGFTAFALEAGGAEAMAVNDYVVHGKGDPRAALAGLGQWPWETEEMVDLVRWLRGYNADPHHRRKVAFYGIDLQGTAEAARRVGSFIARVDRGDAARIARLLAPVQRRVGAAISADLAAIAAQLIARKARYVARSSAAAWQDAEHCAQLLIQIDREARANPRRRLRDRYLADNVRWILDHGPPGAKLVVWGHDGHVAFAHNLTYSMGMHLRAQLGSDYLAIGSVIHHGSTASLQRADDQLRLVEQRLDPPAAGSLEAALATVGRPQLVFDLRAAPPGVAGWFHSQVAARVALEPAHPQPVPTVLAEAYDALLYVEVATPATPIPAARARW